MCCQEAPRALKHGLLPFLLVALLPDDTSEVNTPHTLLVRHREIKPR